MHRAGLIEGGRETRQTGLLFGIAKASDCRTHDGTGATDGLGTVQRHPYRVDHAIRL